MMKITISAAALIAVAAFVAVPANADYLGGGPIKNSAGKCWKGNTGRDATYGAWVDCPSAASGSGVPCSAGQLAWEKGHQNMNFFDHCARGGNAGAAANASAKPAATNQRAAR